MQWVGQRDVDNDRGLGKKYRNQEGNLILENQF